MTRGDADRWAEKPGAASLGSGRNPREGEVGASRVTARLENSKPETKRLMEAVVERENMVQALSSGWKRTRERRAWMACR